MLRDGVMTAQSDRFHIHVQGRGGHGARPHETTDAIIVAGFLITALQTLVSRESNPLHPAVVTVGQVSAGSAPNVIAGEAWLAGSIRTTLEDERRHIHRGMARMADAIGDLHEARVELRIEEGYPPVVNSEAEVEVARRAASSLLGRDQVFTALHPSMGSEDFAYYLHRVPGCFVRFGARRPDQDPVPLHSSAFDIDEEVLAVGAAYFDAVAREQLAYAADRQGAEE